MQRHERQKNDFGQWHAFNVKTVAGKKQCPTCDKFVDKTKLKRHMEIHTGHFSFYCAECKKGYNQKGNYIAHVSSKHEGISFPCNRCDRRFKNEASLKSHMSEHTGQWKFTCSLCNKGFNIKKTYEIHENKHMGNDFRCIKCGYAFYHEDSLRKHRETCA